MESEFTMSSNQNEIERRKALALRAIQESYQVLMTVSMGQPSSYHIASKS